MFYRVAALVCVVATMLFGVVVQSGAEVTIIPTEEHSNWELREISQSRVSASKKVLADYRTSMEAKPVDKWATEELDRYYYLALRYLFAKIDFYRYNGGKLPYRLEFVAEGKSARDWPGDPLNDWKPLPILTVTDTPVRGGVVWQVCPPEYYTQYEDTDYVRQTSHQLSIYGLGVDGSYQPTVDNGNAKWAVINPGTLATIGHYETPFTLTAGVNQDKGALLETATTHQIAMQQALDAFDNKLVFPDEMPNLREQWLVASLLDVYQTAGKLEKLAAELKKLPRTDWDAEDINEYLTSAQWLVCSSLYAYSNPYEYPACELSTLVDTGFLPAIPLNPLNNWEPMQILQVGQGFSPGDLTYQSCSPNQFSPTPNGPWPASFEIGVYGSEPFPIEDREEQLVRKGYSGDWVKLPDGTLQQFGRWSQTLAQTDYRRAICFT